MPSLAQRANFVETNPVHIARMYQRLMQAVIKCIIGWDTRTDRAVDGGGLFGICRYFYLVNECQCKGSLHCHGIICLEGAPSVQDLLFTLDNDPEYAAAYIAFYDTVVSACVPLHNLDASRTVVDRCVWRNAKFDQACISGLILTASTLIDSRQPIWSS